MSGDLRARLERERDVLEHLVYHPCPCPRTTPVPEVAAVTAIIDHLARILDDDPDTPTTDVRTDAPVDDGKDKLDANLSDRASDDSDALLVEQIARVLVSHHDRTQSAAWRTWLPKCSCGESWERGSSFAVHVARAVVVARPWQAEVETARQDALNQAADEMARLDVHVSSAQGLGVAVRWLRYRAATE